MKKITQMFPRVGTSTIMNTLDKHHISIEEPEKTTFSDVNLVTGPNGAGKTRLLNALLELYQKVQDVEILYGYFPALSCSRPQPQAAKPDGEPPWEYTLREYQNISDVFFKDFFKEIEAQGEEFLSQLRTYRSQNEKGMNQRTFRQIARFFSEFTGKELVMGRDLIVKNSGGVQTSLAEAIEWLSPGERMLFYMSIFFSLKRSGKGKCVIILDEPESHLHPKALLCFVKALMGTFSGATIWIATHSLFLLPEFQFENIVYLENGKVLRRRSSLYRKALAGLLGEDSENVSRFFASLPHWQYYEFIAECFTNPTVVSTVNPEDEQVRIFIEALKKHEITRVLDCGGGSGRLGLSMMETTAAEWGSVTYDIYDAWPAYKGRKFKVYKKLKDAPGEYDCIVMMNFLHEVSPQEWIGWFRKLHDLMASNGHLLFVEMEALQIGEYPNDTGYLVLGPDELRVLFDLKAELPKIQIGGNPKSFGALVAREDLLNVSNETVFSTIQQLERRSYLELDAIRAAENKRRAEEKAQNKPVVIDEKKKALDARKYAFYSQQYINIRLSYDEVQIWAKSEQQKKEARAKEDALRTDEESNSRKDSKLTELLSKMDVLLSKEHSVTPRTSNGIAVAFRNAVKEFQKDRTLSSETYQGYKSYLRTAKLLLYNNKPLIAVLLRIGSLIGDSEAAREFDLLKYANYLP